MSADQNERDSLRDEIERLRGQVDGQATEIQRLRISVANADVMVTGLARANAIRTAGLESSLQLMRRYGVHLPDCGCPCDCGLSAALGEGEA